MGYGVPAAIGMKRLAPERTVVAFAVDGDFLMTGQEFATAVQYDLQVIVVVADNGMYGPSACTRNAIIPAVVATGLKNPVFAVMPGPSAAMVRRWKKQRISSPRSKPRKGRASRILHRKIDPEALTPAMSLTATREKAQAGG